MKQALVEFVVFGYQYFYRFFYNLSIEQIYRKDENAAKTAHIFGSGASAIQTKTLLNSDAVTIGCNLTLALLPRWNIGFVERLEDNSFGHVQMQALMERDFGKLILKNTYPFRLNKTRRNLRVLNSKHDLSLLKECQVVAQRNDIEHIVDQVMDQSVMRQYASSVLTMIMYAVRSGFKRIIIHGVDFGGDSFYDKEPFKKYSFKVSPNTIKSKHQTDEYVVPFSEVLTEVIERLKKDGIVVQFAKELL